MKNQTLNSLTATAMFTALSIVVTFFNFTILPQVPYLKYDAGDILILIVTFIFGPVYGIISTVITSLFQAMFLSADGWFGGLMHIISTSALILPAGLIYMHKKSRTRAIIGLMISCVAVTVAMLGFNYILSPMFYGMPREVVVISLPWIGLFNLIKSVINSTVTLLVYKHIGKLIRNFN